MIVLTCDRSGEQAKAGNLNAFKRPEGWDTVDGKDVCPSCLAKYRDLGRKLEQEAKETAAKELSAFWATQTPKVK